MSLELHLVLILSATVVPGALVEQPAQTLVVQRSFDELEELEARRNLDKPCHPAPSLELVRSLERKEGSG